MYKDKFPKELTSANNTAHSSVNNAHIIPPCIQRVGSAFQPAQDLRDGGISHEPSRPAGPEDQAVQDLRDSLSQGSHRRTELSSGLITRSSVLSS